MMDPDVAELVDEGQLQTVSHLGLAGEGEWERERENLGESDDEDAGQHAVEMSSAFNEEWGSNTEEEANNLDNDIDVQQFKPVDLSNDIAVNDIAAADPNFPHNPYAEVVNVSELHKFERLSQPPTAVEHLMK